METASRSETRSPSDDRRLAAFVEELSFLIRARYSLLQLTTYEESRCLDVLRALSEKRGGTLYVWSRTDGVVQNSEPLADVRDPLAVLKWYEDTPRTGKSVLVLKDYHPFLKEPIAVRKLRDLAQRFKGTSKTLVLVSPVSNLPAELVKDVTVLDVPLPSREEILSLVEKAATVVRKEGTDTTGEVETFPPIDAEALADAATGLTYDEIESVLAKSIVSRGTLDRRLVQDEKRQIVKKSGVLEFVDTGTASTAGVGGLALLKQWLGRRRGGLSPSARALGLPAPKGILLVGVPGCGKSLTAMTVGAEWQLPLVRLDLGRVFSGLVGSSESNVRQAIATCEAVAPCVLWIDEIEKGLAGTKSSGSSDGGTTSRVFGTLLTWMQEKKSTVFVVATANDISQLPPEFLRKGRFDEIFFIDLPTTAERQDIFRIQLERYRWEPESLDIAELARESEGFSGAEIEQAVVSGRYAAFGDGEPFHQRHVLQAIAETVPLSKTMGDRLDGLREWAKHRARPASVREASYDEDGFAARTSRLEMGRRG
jgi:predicted kinase